MTTATSEIDFSTFPGSDGEPMAETAENMAQMIDLMFALGILLRSQGRTQVVVSGNQLLYYNEQNGWDHVSPDTYVALDIAPGPCSIWQTWVEGKCPDIVFEITSPSTMATDLSEKPKGKRQLYAELGVREYYIYDPNGKIVPRFLGFELRHGRFESLPVLSSGGIVSPLLQVELRPMDMVKGDQRPAGTYLRVIDPTTGAPVPVADEEHRANQDLKARLSAAEHLRLETEQRVSQEAHARRGRGSPACGGATGRAGRGSPAGSSGRASAPARCASRSALTPPSQAMMMMLGAGRTRYVLPLPSLAESWPKTCCHVMRGSSKWPACSRGLG